MGPRSTFIIAVEAMIVLVGMSLLCIPASSDAVATEVVAEECNPFSPETFETSMDVAEDVSTEIPEKILDPPAEAVIQETVPPLPIDIIAFGSEMGLFEATGGNEIEIEAPCGHGSGPDDRGTPPEPRGPQSDRHVHDEPVTDTDFEQGPADTGEHKKERGAEPGPGDQCLPDPTTYKPREKPSDTVAPHPPDYSVDPEFEKNVIDPMEDDGRYGEITKTKRYSLSFAVVAYLNQLSQDMQTGYSPDDRRYEDGPDVDDTVSDTECAIVEDEEQEPEETIYTVTAEHFIPLTGIPAPVLKVGPGIVQA